MQKTKLFFGMFFLQNTYMSVMTMPFCELAPANERVRMGRGAMPAIEDLENEALWDIEQMLQQQGRSLSE